MNVFYEQVGAVGMILILFGLFVLTLLLLKFYQFLRLGVWKKQLLSDNEQVLDQKQFSHLLNKLKHSNHPAAKTIYLLLQLKYVENKPEDYVESSVQRIGNKSLQQLEQYLRPLEVLSHLSPLVGLLGTVIGIIMAFSAIKSATYVDPGLLSSGISHALITTALGLSVAIPAQIGFHYLDSKVDKVRQMMSDYVQWSNHLIIR